MPKLIEIEYKVGQDFGTFLQKLQYFTQIVNYFWIFGGRCSDLLSDRSNRMVAEQDHREDDSKILRLIKPDLAAEDINTGRAA